MEEKNLKYAQYYEHENAAGFVPAARTYPMQVFSSLRKTQTLSVDASFALPSPDDAKTSYLEGVNYCAFHVSLIGGEPRTSVTGSIPITQVPVLVFRAESTLQRTALLKERKPAQAASSGGQASAAYTATLLYGPFKGQTPAGVLLANPGNKDEILKSRDFLQSNLEKYPTNAALIAAIEEAVALSDAGKLDATLAGASQSAAPGRSIPVFQIPYGYTPKKKANAAGERNYFTLRVLLYPDRDKSRWSVELETFFAPVDGNAVQRAKATEVKKMEYSMTDNEFLEMLYAMRDTALCYQMASFPIRYRYACEDAERQRAAYRNNGNAAPAAASTATPASAPAPAPAAAAPSYDPLDGFEDDLPF